MKKLMIAAAIVCAAAFAQAAQVEWSAANKIVNPTTGAVTTSIDGQIWLVAISDTTGWSDGTWSGTSSTVTELQAGTIGTGTKSAGAVGDTYTFTYGDVGQKIKDGDFLAVVVKDSAGKYSQFVYYDDKAPVIDALTVAGLADDGNAWSKSLTFASDGNYTVQSVPEPTSALLLLLGVAGLALKRRRA